MPMARRYVSAIPAAWDGDYATEEEVRQAWEDGKDFYTMDLVVHGYVSIRDKPDDVVLNIRFNKQMEVCVIPDAEGKT